MSYFCFRFMLSAYRLMQSACKIMSKLDKVIIVKGLLVEIFVAPQNIVIMLSQFVGRDVGLHKLDLWINAFDLAFCTIFSTLFFVISDNICQEVIITSM